MSGELQKLKDWHRELARCLASGMTVREIAVQRGKTEAGIRYARKSPLFQKLLGELHMENDKEAADFASRVDTCRQMAIERVEENLEACASIDKGLQMKTAWDILDRGANGHKVPDKVIEQTTNIQVNQIHEMSDAELEIAARQNAEVILNSPALISETDFPEPVDEEQLGLFD